jgi:NADH dehydrogenase
VDGVKTVAVTGASGYVGVSLCRRLIAQGVAVRALSRRDPAIVGSTFVPYDLRRDLPPDALTGVDAVIHAAAETSLGSDPDGDAELAGLVRLLDASRAVQARFILISSQAARPDAPTGYGRLKAKAEEMVLARQGVVVRPGQVYGGPEKGLWGSLAAVARRAPVIPRFLPEPVVQPIHVEDLAEALAILALRASSEARIHAVADPAPVAFSRFIQLIALCRFGRMPWRLPVPMAPLLLAIRAAGALGIRPSFARRLASLNDLPILDSANDMARLGLAFQRFPAGLGRSPGGDAALIREGSILVRYATGARPSRWIVRRYVRALASLGETRPLEWPAVLCIAPSLLLWFDQPAARRRGGEDDALSRRIDLALLLAESSVEHVDSFLLASARPRRLAQMTSLAFALPAEALARLVDVVARPWLDRCRPRPIGGVDHAA